MRIVLDGKTIYSLDVTMGGISRDQGLSFYGIAGEIGISSGFNAFADFDWNSDTDTVVLKLHDMSLFDFLPGREKIYTKEEFLEALWEKICGAIENIT